ncbi:IclR family transcriptional regulator [Cryobacterium sp. SO1]|uniref:IclR family transcriptional regulator n=1 Tax=Cryobacterium sp. SO1 TaxID=1897061 RepID=UPI0010234358|nr:helix-turn-helix domain-containing protein [Cryobacterium sp. SO1]RZI35243.1 putative HTH-type transcriptional regulator RhmR [Cryobacterium sp. SO1]
MSTEIDGAAVPGSQPESQAAERVVRILEVVADANKPLSVAEIAAELGLHRSIIYRFLRTLLRTRLVRQRADGGYELGPGLVALALKVTHDVPALIRPRLQLLADTCGATAFITELDENRSLCLMSVEPTSSRTHLIFRPGTVGPVDRGAAVMAIFSGLPAVPGEPQEAAKARIDGYAWSAGTITPGIECVASPVLLPMSDVPASVAVIYPVGSRVVEHVVEEVRSAAAQIDALFT